MLLLDTSALIWVLIDSPRLGRQARKRITQASVVHVSAVSVAELTIKAMLGRIGVPEDLPAALRQQSLVELPLTAEHAAAVTDFPALVRHDPFDRLLLAQARTAGLDFLTSDRTLLGLGLDFVVDAGG